MILADFDSSKEKRGVKLSASMFELPTYGREYPTNFIAQKYAENLCIMMSGHTIRALVALHLSAPQPEAVKLRT